MDDPAYAGGEPPKPDVPAEPTSWRDVESIYSLTLSIYKNGHACSYLNRVDMGSRRSISERLNCQPLVRGTRISILQGLLCAVSQALLDAEHDASQS